MIEKAFQVNFSVLRKFFKAEGVEDKFVIFDNLIEVAEKNELVNANMYDFPVKQEGTMMAFCTDGYSKTKIGLEEIILQKGHVMVVLSGQIFQLIELSPDFKAIFIIMKNSFFNIQNHLVEAITLQQLVARQHCLHVPDSFEEEFLLIYNIIKKKIRENALYLEPIIQNYFSILFYNACNIYIQKKKEDQFEIRSHKGEIFEIFIREVEVYYREEHEVLFYANKLCLTPKYLSKLIFQISGKSAVTWIKDYLLLEAQTLLKSTGMTIQEISDELNFANQSHFGRFFKKRTGVSPKKYRKE